MPMKTTWAPSLSMSKFLLICPCCAGHRHYGGPLIVVDFGTATSFDIVSEEGDFVGGIIAPGVNLSVDALYEAAAKLPRIAVGTVQTEVNSQAIIWGLMGTLTAKGLQVQHFLSQACFAPLDGASAVTGIHSRNSQSSCRIGQREEFTRCGGTRLSLEPTCPRAHSLHPSTVSRIIEQAGTGGAQLRPEVVTDDADPHGDHRLLTIRRSATPRAPPRRLARVTRSGSLAAPHEGS